MTLPRVELLREAGGDIPRMLAGLPPENAPHRPKRGEYVSLLIANGQYLLDAADALDDLHARVCGCDDPGRESYCSFEEFAALVPLRAE